MGCRIIEDRENEMAVFYCSTTMVAFGPVMPSRDVAEKFLQVLPGDPRNYPGIFLRDEYTKFVMSYVCECGELRQDECEFCKDGDPLKDGAHINENFIAPMPCVKQPEPAAGERFECEWCKTKEAKRQRKMLDEAKAREARKAGLR